MHFSLLTKKVSQRIAPSEDFLYGRNLEFQDAAITYCLFFFGVIDTSLQLALRQAQRPNNSSLLIPHS